jgi:hypothetical protein
VNRERGVRRSGACLRAAAACLLISLAAAPGAIAEAPTAKDAAFKSEWEKVRDDQDREIRSNGARLAEIIARERRAPVELEARADKITRDRVAGLRSSVKSDTLGSALVQMAEQALVQPGRPVDVYQAQETYLSNARREWAKDGERKKVQDAHAALQKNLDLASASLAAATEAARAMARAIQQSGVLEKTAQTDAASKEVRERLAARFERERAERERERVQREREAAERARTRP